jgi:glycerol-3-phosphate dehydrogenase subunit B
MTYDVVVVGAGLAGLTAALRLAEEGQSVMLVARGVGATHLSPATIDVLGYAPERVASPARALPDFVASRRDHPYARVGVETVGASVEWLRRRVAGSIAYVGGLDDNMLLPTPAGVAKPSALVPETAAAGDLRGGGAFVFVGLRGLKDFYPHFLAANLARAELPAGVSVAARAVEIAPPLGGERDVSALGFARRFERHGFRHAVVHELKPLVGSGERIGFPGVLGLEHADGIRRELEDRLGGPVFEVPTLPPSVQGIRLYQALVGALRAAGGRILVGEAVMLAEVRGGAVTAVGTLGGPRPVFLRGRSFVLASGGWASGGLELDSFGNVRETVFQLPVAGVPAAGEPRFARGYFDHHPLSAAGVAADDMLRPVDEQGEPVYENVHVAGATLAGAVPWREGSGNGISLATGFAAADAIRERGVEAIGSVPQREVVV